MFKLPLLVLVFAVFSQSVEGHWWGGHRYRFYRWGHWTPTPPKPALRPGCTLKPADPNAKLYLFGGKTYVFSSTKLNFQAALESCKSACGNLVSINSVAEQKFIESKMDTISTTESWYIGLTRVGQMWMWSSSEPLTYNNIMNPGATGYCSLITQTPGKKWLITSTCTNAHRYICEVM